MNLGAALGAELEQEARSTRIALERIPADRLDWKPHDKSMDFRGLATHLSNLPSWVNLALEQDAFDIAPVGEAPPRATPVDSPDQAVATFDENVGKARAALQAADDAQLAEPWSLMAAGNVVFTMPRGVVVRSMVLNHLIHHRAQLGVYLRLVDVPVPSMFGPTADEG